MSKHDDDTCPHLVRASLLEAENARLKAEVERLKAVSTIEQRTIQGLQQTPEWSEIARLTAECRRLEAENSRLRASSFVTAVPVEQYERVIKAGDAMDRQARYTWLRSLQTDTQKRKDWLKNLHQSLIDWKVAKGCEPTKDGEDCDL